MVRDVKISGSMRRDIYFTQLYPLFKEINSSTDEIIKMNQENMVYMKAMAQKQAETARTQMYLYLLLERWLRPCGCFSPGNGC